MFSNSNIGVPIVKWFAVDEMSDSFSDYSLHIIVSLSNDTAQTCPIRVDKTLVRKNICLYSSTKNVSTTRYDLSNFLLIYLFDIRFL